MTNLSPQPSVALGLLASAVLVACGLVALGSVEESTTGNNQISLLAQRQTSVLRRVAHEIEGFSVPKGTSLKAAQALSAFETLCGSGHGGGMTKAQMTRIRKRADDNWWHVIKAFKTADEIQSEILADPNHVHLIIYVAPGWCHFSQMQISELQKNFDNLGASQNRVHFVGE